MFEFHLPCVFALRAIACVYVCVWECRSCHCRAAAGLGASAAVVVDVDANADLYVCNKRGACKTQGKSFYVTDLKFLLITPHECEGGNGRESFSLNAGELHTYIQMYLLCGTCCYVSCDNVCLCLYVHVCEGKQSVLSIHHTPSYIQTYEFTLRILLPIDR